MEIITYTFKNKELSKMSISRTMYNNEVFPYAAIAIRYELEIS